MHGSREIGARDSSVADGVFAGFDADRAARGSRGSSPRRETMKRLRLIVENLVTNTLPLR